MKITVNIPQNGKKYHPFDQFLSLVLAFYLKREKATNFKTYVNTFVYTIIYNTQNMELK